MLNPRALVTTVSTNRSPSCLKLCCVVQSELLGAIADGYHPKLSRQLHDIRFYQFPAEFKGQLFCAWLGGAMFASFDHSLDQRSLTRDEWMETKKVPD